MENLVKKMANKTWGKWYLDETLAPSLNFALPWDTYKIALSKCRTISQRKLWLEHMEIKRYINKRDLVDLRRAFNDLVAAEVLPNELTLRE